MGATDAALLRLLDQFGPAEHEVAIDEALKRDVPHLNAVILSLTWRRVQRGTPPPILVDLPKDSRMRPGTAGLTGGDRHDARPVESMRSTSLYRVPSESDYQISVDTDERWLYLGFCSCFVP